MSKFRLGVFIAFIVFAAIGVFFFASFRGQQGTSDIEITLWGTMSQRDFTDFLADFNKNTNRSFKVKYKEVDENSFADEVVEALASGENPDIIMISSSNLLEFENKILPIPFESISERNFKDAFVEGGEVFLSREGILALPLTVDPLVSYWNRDILQSSGLSSPPKFWSEFFSFAERITDKDNALNIRRAAVAMGEFQNVDNAKEILLSMILQNGNPVVIRNVNTNQPQAILSENFDRVTVPAESAVRFYTEFSNPTKTSYSWNRSLPNSFDSFSSGDLALYFGFASELDSIKDRNPNLNFDVALFPQPSTVSAKKVNGEFTALAVLKRSKNPAIAIQVISSMTRGDNIEALSLLTGLPPVRRDLLSRPARIGAEDVFFKSALIAHGFMDPNVQGTNEIFRKMIENVVSGRERITEAVRRSNSELIDLVVDN